MIYITVDTHSDFSRFTEENFQIQSEMTKDDYIIIQLKNGKVEKYTR